LPFAFCLLPIDFGVAKITENPFGAKPEFNDRPLTEELLEKPLSTKIPIVLK